MEKTLINIKTDKKLKRDVQKVASDLGLPLGTIINSYLRDLVREKRVVFSIPPTPNIKTQKMLRKIESDMRTGKNQTRPLTYEEAIDYLDRQ